jgi:hypothetical protein
VADEALDRATEAAKQAAEQAAVQAATQKARDEALRALGLNQGGLIGGSSVDQQLASTALGAVTGNTGAAGSVISGVTSPSSGSASSVTGSVTGTATSAADKAINGAINGAINAEVGKIIAIPDSIKQVGQTALTLATDIGNIVSSGAALLQVATSGNMGFLTVPALGALTVAQIAALKNIGSQMDSHGQALGGAAKSYASTEQTITSTTAKQQANNDTILNSNSTLLSTVNADSATSTRQVGDFTTNAGGSDTVEV